MCKKKIRPISINLLYINWTLLLMNPFFPLKNSVYRSVPNTIVLDLYLTHNIGHEPYPIYESAFTAFLCNFRPGCSSKFCMCSVERWHVLSSVALASFERHRTNVNTEVTNPQWMSRALPVIWNISCQSKLSLRFVLHIFTRNTRNHAHNLIQDQEVRCETLLRC